MHLLIAFSPELGVEERQFNSPYLKAVKIVPEQFKWPSNSEGKFKPYLAQEVWFLCIYLKDNVIPADVGRSPAFSF